MSIPVETGVLRGGGDQRRYHVTRESSRGPLMDGCACLVVRLHVRPGSQAKSRLGDCFRNGPADGLQSARAAGLRLDNPAILVGHGTCGNACVCCIRLVRCAVGECAHGHCDGGPFESPATSKKRPTDDDCRPEKTGLHVARWRRNAGRLLTCRRQRTPCQVVSRAGLRRSALSSRLMRLALQGRRR